MMAWIGIYLIEVPTLLASMVEQVQTGDNAALARTIHELKPQFHYLDAPVMQERLAALQQQNATDGARSCAELVEEVRRLGERIEEELREHLQHG